LLHFGAKISDLQACCILERKSPICMTTCLAFGFWVLAFWLWLHLALGFWLSLAFVTFGWRFGFGFTWLLAFGFGFWLLLFFVFGLRGLCTSYALLLNVCVVVLQFAYNIS